MVENYIDIPDDFCCPITGDLMEDPVVASDGHSYERESITAWFQRKKTSPLTGLVLESTILTDNHSLRAIINTFKENIPKIQLENQIKADLLEAINMRQAFLEDHMEKEKEQFGNLAQLYSNEKEKNLSLERKLNAYKKQIKHQADEIDSLNKNAEYLVSKIEEKDEEIKWLYEELGKSLDDKGSFNRTSSFKIKRSFSGPEIGEIIEGFVRQKFGFFLCSLNKIDIKLEERLKRIKSGKARDKLSEIKESVSYLIWTIECSKDEFNELIQEQETEIKKDFYNSEFSLSTVEDFKNDFALEKAISVEMLKDKRSAILYTQNSPEIEQDFREMLVCENEKTNLAKDSLFLPIYQDYIASYCRIASLYTIDTINSRTNLFIYDTEYENKEEKVLETPEPLNSGTCITQLPNGELFCFGRCPASGISLKICKNYSIQELPSRTPCYYSSAIYFNRKVYCFGGENNGTLDLSLIFDLDKNDWYLLSQMPQTDCKCHCILWNDDILIAGFYSTNLLRYSINSDSFSKISFEFSEKKRKILINVKRLYLIECGLSGKIYESEINNENDWIQIGNSRISDSRPNQVYCSYNKGAIYICCRGFSEGFYKFSLSEKAIQKI